MLQAAATRRTARLISWTYLASVAISSPRGFVLRRCKPGSPFWGDNTGAAEPLLGTAAFGLFSPGPASVMLTTNEVTCALGAPLVRRDLTVCTRIEGHVQNFAADGRLQIGCIRMQVARKLPLKTLCCGSIHIVYVNLRAKEAGAPWSLSSLRPRMKYPKRRHACRETRLDHLRLRTEKKK